MFIILPYNSFPVDLPDEAIQRDFIAKLATTLKRQRTLPSVLLNSIECLFIIFFVDFNANKL